MSLLTLVPPYTVITLKARPWRFRQNLVSVSASCPICCASSRVGLMARMGTWPSGGGRAITFSMAGTRNAIVFPVPVLAFTITSWGPRHTGRACSCTPVQNW